MKFGVYVHIPYCLQRCVYCDFATYEFSQILPPNDYLARVKKEITSRASEIGPRPLDTLYFGGGTPSLLDPELLIDLVETLAQQGFERKPSAEVTLEINPATLDAKKIERLVKAGFNRFSVGAQTFDEELLKIAHRKHSAKDTRDTLNLLKALGLNYSADLLFALPTQNIDGLKRDLDEFEKFSPPHISPYCLTVPETNPMAKNRAPDEIQAKMFEVIAERLKEVGLNRYEISNFAKPGFESRHNLSYWNDDEYWGIGLSAHSYLRREPWGVRFWNPRSIDQYQPDDNVDPKLWQLAKLQEKNGEWLTQNQALTDFFHVSLRRTIGVDRRAFEEKFDAPIDVFQNGRIIPSLSRLKNKGWLQDDGRFLSLTNSGVLLSNQVFEELTFIDKKDHNTHIEEQTK